MVPSDFRKLSQAQQREVHNGIRRQGVGSESPLGLIQSLNKYRDPRRVNATYNARIVNYWMDDTNYPKFHVESEILSSDGGNAWKQEIVFLSPDISVTPASNRLGIPVKTKNGKSELPDEVWWMKTLPIDTPIKVRCSCPDFQHSFSWEDYDVGSLKGRRIQYLSTGTRAPRNPEHHHGVCKHLGSLLNVLQRSTNVIVKSPQLRPSALYIG